MSGISKNTHSGIKSVKIEDVAKAAGVSIMSVSRAMRGVEGISAKKREQILNIARDLGYFPNRVAVSLAASSSNLIGVSLPTLFGSVFAEIYDGMRASFEKAGYATMLDMTEYSLNHEEEWVERMISWRTAGIVLCGTDHNESTKARLQKAKIPVLEIWDKTDTPIDLCVGVDHFAAGASMGQFLISLGYCNPSYVGVRFGIDKRADRRFLGMQSSFEAAGITFQAIERSQVAASFESGFQCTQALLDSANTPPDLICYLNDNMAFGGMMCVERNGLTCPQDIGVVGYNGLNINSVLPKRITTSITPRKEMGEIAARLLVAKILGAHTQTTITLPVTIDPGQTTCSK